MTITLDTLGTIKHFGITSKSDEGMAVFDRKHKYRYLLMRQMRMIGPKSGRVMVAVMLNPSIADATTDDPTTSFMRNFAVRNNCFTYYAVNCFPLIDTDPKGLRTAKNPRGGPLGDWYIEQTTKLADILVVAWGNHGEFQGRFNKVLGLLPKDKPQYCFGLTKSGQPKFPRALPIDVELQEYK